jgi:hypothetical protein
MWVLVASSVLAFAVLFYRTRRKPPDLGHVSDRWLAEHRAYQAGESR